MSRTRSSVLNVISGTLLQGVFVVLSFICRTVFIRTLSVDYLGINGLFSNILTVLSLAELGVGNAIIFDMYKPLAIGDQARLTALINYYRKLYNIIAAVVAILGLLLVPFLKYLVRTSVPLDRVTEYYLLYLANTVVSYLIVYKTSIISADQKSYWLNLIRMVFIILQNILQIIVLVVWHSFILYILMQVICSLLINMIGAGLATKMYPFIRGKEKLPAQSRRRIWTNIRSFFIYQLGGAVLNNTDNILISIILGTACVGYYSNYSLLISTVAGFTSMVFVAVQASVGNLNVEKDPKKQLFIFKVLNLISFWLYGFCVVCFIILFQDFIRLWIGKKFLLDMFSICMAVCTFYLQGVLYPIWCYRNTTGLFRQTKFIMLFASAINLILSVWLGYAIGLAGILLATVIARLSTNIWFEPTVLYHIYFHKKVSRYFILQAFYLLLLLVTVGITFLSTRWINGTTIVGFIGKMVLCLIIPNLIFFVTLRKTRPFRYIQKHMLGKLKQRALPTA